ncbi:MAG: bile acid:sodium symporter [Patescibacteria group bacterium]
MLKYLRSLIESYLFILIASLGIGIFLPQIQILSAWNTLFLQIIFFLSSLKLDIDQFTHHLKDWKTILVTAGFMLLALPVLVRILLFPFGDLFAGPALALFLLAAMPAGMTAPLLVEIVGGKQAMALVITITTSLLAPFSIPLITLLAYRTSVHVDAFGMFQKLALVIFIPFIIAMIVKRLSPKKVAKIASHTKPISIFLLGLLIATAIAPYAERLQTSFVSHPSTALILIALLFVFFAILHILGYNVIWWKSRSDRQTISVCLTYMNFTLAIYLASRFFPDPTVILTLILSIIPWAVMLPLWKKFSTAK